MKRQKIYAFYRKLWCKNINEEQAKLAFLTLRIKNKLETSRNKEQRGTTRNNKEETRSFQLKENM